MPAASAEGSKLVARPRKTQKPAFDREDSSRADRDSLWGADNLAPRPRRQRRQERVGVVSQEPNRPVAEQEVCATGVKAPEMEDVTLLVQASVAKRVRPNRTHIHESRPRALALPHPQHLVCRTGVRLAFPRVPPPVPEVRAGRAFPDQQGHRGSVQDVRQPDP